MYRSKSSVFFVLSSFFKQKFEFSYHLIEGERLSSVVVGAVKVSADKHLDFHNTTFLVRLSIFKA